MGCHFLLQEIFPTQRLNPCLPHCRQMLYHLSHQGSTHQGSHFSIKLYLISSMLRIMVLKARGNNRIRILYKYSFVLFSSAHPRSQSANINVINQYYFHKSLNNFFLHVLSPVTLLFHFFFTMYVFRLYSCYTLYCFNLISYTVAVLLVTVLHCSSIILFMSL